MTNQFAQYAFQAFPKMGRWSRDLIITEKLDGTNGQIFIDDLGEKMLVGSRKRWVVPGDDNFGFAAWAYEHQDELMELGPGRHFGEWWGKGIQRNYGLDEKRFSLFNVARWSDPEVRPACCSVVPTLWEGPVDDANEQAWNALEFLEEYGSQAAEDFMKPEGIIIFHTAANVGFKKTIEHDNMPKSLIGR
jgi:hypothetical protein